MSWEWLVVIPVVFVLYSTIAAFAKQAVASLRTIQTALEGISNDLSTVKHELVRIRKQVDPPESESESEWDLPDG